MSERGPRAGWTWGGLGSLLWILVFGVILAARGHAWRAILCFGLFGAGAAYLSAFAPWKHRDIPLWKPYLGFVLLLFASAAVLLAALHGLLGSGERLSPWLLLLLLPLLSPLFTFGRKSWNDLHGRS